MTLDELNAELAGEKKDETLAALKEAGYRTPDEVLAERKGVDGKNKEILSEKKKIQESLDALETEIDELKKIRDVLHDNQIAVDDEGSVVYDNLQGALDALKERDPSSANVEQTERELKAAQRELQTATRERKKLLDQLEEKDALLQKEVSYTTKSVIDGAFVSALTKQGYAPAVAEMILPTLRVMSGAQLQTDEENGSRNAIVDDGGSIEAWVELWKDTDTGKSLRIAPTNNGGGASGGGGKIDSHKKWADYSGQEKADLFNSNPEAYRRLRDGAKKK